MPQPGPQLVHARQAAEVDSASVLVRTVAQPTGAFVAGDGVGNENDISMQGHDTLVLYIQSLFGGTMPSFNIRLRFSKVGAGVAGTFFDESTLVAGAIVGNVQTFAVREAQYQIVLPGNHRMSFSIPEAVLVRVEVVAAAVIAAGDTVGITAVRSLSN